MCEDSCNWGPAMVRVVPLLVIVVVVFSAVSAEASFDNINYSVVNTLLQSPVRRREDGGKAADLNKDPDVGVVDENDITHDFKPIVVNPMPKSLTPPSNESTGSVPEGEPISTVYEDTVKTLADIYQECSQKIDKRVESILNWRLTKGNTEKDLIQLKDHVVLLYRCLKVQSFRHLDNVINEDVIPVTQFADLVRNGRSSDLLHMGTGTINGRFSQSWHNDKGRVTSQYVSEIVENDWSALLLDRMSKLLESHTMKFSLSDNAVQGRGRRRDQRMFAMMVMGFMIMATILVPMGFQFLTVLGGKSLLMAKMALIMSAINGLKKIATSQVGYGFYPEDHHDHHHHGFHDKLFKVKASPNDFL